MPLQQQHNATGGVGCGGGSTECTVEYIEAVVVVNSILYKVELTAV